MIFNKYSGVNYVAIVRRGRNVYYTQVGEIMEVINGQYIVIESTRLINGLVLIDINDL